MSQQLRRAAPRQPADWMAFYRLDNHDGEPWRSCRILDISPMGAGLELFGTDPAEPLEGMVTVSLELRGESRNVVRSKDGTTARFGIQFPALTEAAKDYVRKMSGTRW
jgi:hypothetical protein